MILTSNKNKQHFSGSNADTVTFARVIHLLILTVSSNVSMSLDGGTNFMTMTAGTYQFNINTVRLDFSGSGTWSGVGITS